MFRMAFGVGSVAILLLSAAGCQMCCHPYDKSGPVFCGDGCSSSTCSRAGSILAGCPEPSVLPAKNPANQEPASPTPAQAKKQRPSVSYGMAGSRAGSMSPTPVQAKKQHRPISYVMAAKRADSPSPTFAENPTPQKSPPYEMTPNRAEGPQLGPAQPGDVPGSERIVSVTERVVGSSADSSHAATETSVASQPLPQTGWTARRPTTELMR